MIVKMALVVVALAATANADTNSRPADCPSEAEIRQSVTRWLAGYLGQGLTPQDVANELVRISDGNLDSIVGEEEFIMSMKVELRTPYLSDLCYIFLTREVDKDGEGIIDMPELLKMIEAAAGGPPGETMAT